MYQNPYSIKPGEKLTPQELFERYLDWNCYQQYVAKVWNNRSECDQGLSSENLCCPDHMRFQEEYNTFFRYFALLKMIENGDHGFSIDSMVKMINLFKLRINQQNKEKLAKYWSGLAYLGFRHLGI